jgi:hypothetical protein
MSFDLGTSTDEKLGASAYLWVRMVAAGSARWEPHRGRVLALLWPAATTLLVLCAVHDTSPLFALVQTKGQPMLAQMPKVPCPKLCNAARLRHLLRGADVSLQNLGKMLRA